MCDHVHNHHRSVIYTTKVQIAINLCQGVVFIIGDATLMTNIQHDMYAKHARRFFLLRQEGLSIKWPLENWNNAILYGF